MAYCPYCMTLTNEAVCPICHKSTGYTPQPWHLPVGASPDGGGRYRVGAALGNGGFGITYIGIESDSGQRVAIKEFFPNKCAQRSGKAVVSLPGLEAVYNKSRKAFLDEGSMLREVQSIPSIVRVRDCFEANNTGYIVMEYLTGVTLEQKVKREGAIPADKLLPKLQKLSEDLGKLHENDVVHRDISPDNIMWMPDGNLKLLDFGAARTMEDSEESHTILIKAGFTPAEQYTHHDQGAWTDIYALCATVYYCLTGQVPLSAPERLENDTLIPPRNLGVALTETQQNALLRGLTVQPKSRTRNMAEFSREFFRPDPPPPPDFWQRLKNWLATKTGMAVLRIVLALAALVVFIAFSSYFS